MVIAHGRRGPPDTGKGIVLAEGTIAKDTVSHFDHSTQDNESPHKNTVQHIGNCFRSTGPLRSIIPEFQSPHGFLRSKACWVCGLGSRHPLHWLPNPPSSYRYGFPGSLLIGFITPSHHTGVIPGYARYLFAGSCFAGWCVCVVSPVRPWLCPVFSLNVPLGCRQVGGGGWVGKLSRGCVRPTEVATLRRREMSLPDRSC